MRRRGRCVKRGSMKRRVEGERRVVAGLVRWGVWGDVGYAFGVVACWVGVVGGVVGVGVVCGCVFWVAGSWGVWVAGCGSVGY